jgi:hypothetical protein
MQKLGKLSIAIVLAWMMSLGLFTSGAFAQHVNQSAANKVAQVASTAQATTPKASLQSAGEESGWPGGHEGFSSRFRFIKIVKITKIIIIERSEHFHGFHRSWGISGCGGRC